MTTFQFSLGPPSLDNHNDDTDDTDDDDDDSSNNHHGDRKRTSGTSGSSSMDVHYPTIADRALQALEEEYRNCCLLEEKTNTNATTPTSNVVVDDDDNDTKIIAAAYDHWRKSTQSTLQQTTNKQSNTTNTNTIQPPHHQLQQRQQLQHDDAHTFPVVWDTIPEQQQQEEEEEEEDHSDFDKNINIEKKKKKKEVVELPIDTNAVRKVVETLSINHNDTNFQKKFVQWQQQQQQQQHHRQNKQNNNNQNNNNNDNNSIPQPQPHPIIPVSSQKAFLRSTPKAVQATANLTRSATLAEAIVRIIPSLAVAAVLSSSSSSLQGDNHIHNNRINHDNDDKNHDHHPNQNQKRGRTLVIDIVGVDHVECSSVAKIQRTFAPLVRWLASSNNDDDNDNNNNNNNDNNNSNNNNYDYDYDSIHLRLIGRDLVSPIPQQQPIPLLLDETSTPRDGNILQTEAVATCHTAVYHEFLAEQQPKQQAEEEEEQEHSKQSSSLFTRQSPDLVVAFNAGIWGYEEWKPTIRYLATRNHNNSNTINTKNDNDNDDTNQNKTAIPLVVTAYTLSECWEDYHTIQQTINELASPSSTSQSSSSSSSSSSYQTQVLWKPETNPYGSNVVRETRSSDAEYKENAYWQAWLFSSLPRGEGGNNHTDQTVYK
ncbi:hypothetical protein IV203_025636 [Nitzschia inconspicua]|uniref:Mitochondrial splicing suppressor 51-like C-terminal domain-containing protein n=1 Tax=Nitzschia inconspicua TaxID=303405 RepID=A0A9K3LGJ3_9STRA|nr:hypothetical protein IV203_025636 [Nitzschia inconspicua]